VRRVSVVAVMAVVAVIVTVVCLDGGDDSGNSHLAAGRNNCFDY
jgi:hypothetical protein